MKRIGLTMGDPGGVGPEVILKALLDADCPDIVSIVFGDPGVFESAARLTGFTGGFHEIDSAEAALPGRLNLIPVVRGASITPTGSSPASGHAAVACIRAAVTEALAGRIHAVVTAPVSKESIRRAGYLWPGHTELLAELTGTKDYAMMLAGGPLRVLLATIHEPLSRVPSLITRERVLTSIRLAHRAARGWAMASPRIAVAGLNPHAGESGGLGSEEQMIIAPAVEEARGEGWPVSGPWPPDVVFRKAYTGEFDLVICMYHDQGLIPLKMIAFDTGVNLTIGLPIVRTSPDHGTAFDIAWTGKASGRSMLEAIRLALILKPV